MVRAEKDTNYLSLKYALEQWLSIISIEPICLSEMMVFPEPQGNTKRMTLSEIEISLAAGYDFALSLEQGINPPLVIGCEQSHPFNAIVTPTVQMGNWVYKFFDMPHEPQDLAQLMKPRILWDYQVYYGQDAVIFPPCTNPITGSTCEWVEGLALHEVAMQPVTALWDYSAHQSDPSDPADYLESNSEWE